MKLLRLKQLRRMLEEGKINRIMHGVYASSDEIINEFWLMSERYKNGIFSIFIIVFLSIKNSVLPLIVFPYANTSSCSNTSIN